LLSEIGENSGRIFFDQLLKAEKAMQLADKRRFRSAYWKSLRQVAGRERQSKLRKIT